MFHFSKRSQLGTHDANTALYGMAIQTLICQQAFRIKLSVFLSNFDQIWTKLDALYSGHTGFVMKH